MILFVKRIFVDVIKLKVSRGDHVGFQVSPKSNDRCPYKRKTEKNLGKLM